MADVYCVLGTDTPIEIAELEKAPGDAGKAGEKVGWANGYQI